MCPKRGWKPGSDRSVPAPGRFKSLLKTPLLLLGFSFQDVLSQLIIIHTYITILCYFHELTLQCSFNVTCKNLWWCSMYSCVMFSTCKALLVLNVLYGWSLDGWMDGCASCRWISAHSPLFPCICVADLVKIRIPDTVRGRCSKLKPRAGNWTVRWMEREEEEVCPAVVFFLCCGSACANVTLNGPHSLYVVAEDFSWYAPTRAVIKVMYCREPHSCSVKVFTLKISPEYTGCKCWFRW